MTNDKNRNQNDNKNRNQNNNQERTEFGTDFDVNQLKERNTDKERKNNDTNARKDRF